MEVMLDLEAMGNGSHAAIVAIGAVMFDQRGVHDKFYTNVSLESSMRAGLKVDASTVLWWMEQSDAARSKLKEMPAQINVALLDFASWMRADMPVWGNGATFDNVILRNAYNATDLMCPWKFFSDRCYRTIKNMRPDIKIQRVGTAHNALDDAESQALHLIELRKAMFGDKS